MAYRFVVIMFGFVAVVRFVAVTLLMAVVVVLFVHVTMAVLKTMLKTMVVRVFAVHDHILSRVIDTPEHGDPVANPLALRTDALAMADSP